MQAETERPSAQTTGILMMVVGVFVLSINDAIGKMLTEGYAPIQIVFIRNLIALPVAFVLALRMGGRGALRSYRPSLHLVRSLLWIGATVMFFSSLRSLPLAEATALVFVAPVFITALSALLLGERVGWRRWLAVLTGLVGVVIVIRPGAAAFQPASLLSLGTAFCYAMLMLSARWVDARESIWTMLLYLTGTTTVLSGLAMPLAWTPVAASDLWLFLGIAVVGTTGTILLTEAFRHAPATVIAPLDYSALIWATALGWLIWGEVPDSATYVGAVVIILSSVFILFRERARNSPALPPSSA